MLIQNGIHNSREKTVRIPIQTKTIIVLRILCWLVRIHTLKSLETYTVKIFILYMHRTTLTVFRIFPLSVFCNRVEQKIKENSHLNE